MRSSCILHYSTIFCVKFFVPTWTELWPLQSTEECEVVVVGVSGGTVSMEVCLQQCGASSLQLVEEEPVLSTEAVWRLQDLFSCH